jgi:hypothetical protein
LIFTINSSWWDHKTFKYKFSARTWRTTNQNVVSNKYIVLIGRFLVYEYSHSEEQVSGFLRGTLVSSTNKTDHFDITEMLLKVALNTITQTHNKITNTNNRPYRYKTWKLQSHFWQVSLCQMLQRSTSILSTFLVTMTNLKQIK